MTMGVDDKICMIEIIKYKGKIMLIYLPDFQQNVEIESFNDYLNVLSITVKSS